MMIKKTYLYIVIVLSVLLVTACNDSTLSDVNAQKINLAVEYNTHAACAFVAQENGQLAEEGSFDVYATGIALAGSLSKGEVDAAYICLVPAITAYANGNIPIKIVCGTHKYGYGLIVNSSKVLNLKDLEKEEIKIGCVKEGGTADVFLNKIIESEGLDKEKVMANVLRMNPSKQVMAIKTNQVDVIVVPEHYASMAAEEEGLEMIVKEEDVWPDMQGSVLVVTEDYLNDNFDEVKNLYKVTEQASQFINNHPKEAAEKVANRLNFFESSLEIDMAKLSKDGEGFTVDNSMIEKSMSNLEYSTSIDKKMVQEIIDYVYKLGYIKDSFPAEDILLDTSIFDL